MWPPLVAAHHITRPDAFNHQAAQVPLLRDGSLKEAPGLHRADGLAGDHVTAQDTHHYRERFGTVRPQEVTQACCVSAKLGGATNADHGGGAPEGV